MVLVDEDVYAMFHDMILRCVELCTFRASYHLCFGDGISQSLSFVHQNDDAFDLYDDIRDVSQYQFAKRGFSTCLGILDSQSADQLSKAPTAKQAILEKAVQGGPGQRQKEAEGCKHFDAGVDQIFGIATGTEIHQDCRNAEKNIPINSKG